MRNMIMPMCRTSLRRMYSSSKMAASDMIKISEMSPGITYLTMMRHEGKNSFSKQMVSDFRSALQTISRDDKSRVLIINSDVPKVFCAGADLKERLSMSEEEIPSFVAQLRDAFTELANIPVPTIAAIEGVALGGGLELALACDMRIASKTTLLGLPETALAIIPGAGGTQRLPRLVGVPKAKELIFLAKRMKGEEAAQIGLVTEAVEPGTTVIRSHEIAEQIAAKGPVGIKMAKEAIDKGMSALSMEAALEVERTCYAQVVPTQDRLEGLKAFAEKRDPEYRGL